MDYEEIKYTIEDGLATITLNNPEVMNATSQTMREEISDALQRSRDDKEVKVIMLTGEGRAFSAGDNMRKLARAGAIRPADFRPYRPFGDVLEEINKPVIILERTDSAKTWLRDDRTIAKNVIAIFKNRKTI